MSNTTVKHKLTISRDEAKEGTRKLLTRRGRRLEVTIPAGVRTGSLVRLSGALQITDGYYGDILIQIKVKRRHRKGVLIAVLAAVAIACLFVGIHFLTNSDSENKGYIYTNGAIECGGDGEPIVLINYPDATNPTYAKLVAFIKRDPTDTNSYLKGGPKDYVCADFAEDVHNNAEAAGIRAAWVGIDIEGEDKGHALNAFETTDRGLVYIDCTGDSHGTVYVPTLDAYLCHPTPKPEPTTWDTVAYVEKGKEYGRIDTTRAGSLSYSFYQEYMQKWQEFKTGLEAYNREVESYNQEISGKVYTIGSAEDIRTSLWEARLEEEDQALDKLAKELGGSCYEQMGIVKDIHIHWGKYEISFTVK